MVNGANEQENFAGLRHLVRADFIQSSFVCLAVFLVYHVIHRLYFHPLSKFPGPWIAALTRWYEFYHDVIQDGTYVKYYPVLHAKYNSPVVRISPNHVHVNEPDVYYQVYQSADFLKAPYFYENLGIDNSLVGLTDPVEHRIHRNIVNPMFSARSIQEISHGAVAKVQKAADLMRAKSLNGQTVDIISQTLFGESQSLVESDEDQPEFLVSIDMFTSRMWLTKHFSVLNKIALNLPPFMAERIAPGYAHFRAQCAIWIKQVQQRRQQGSFSTADGRTTIFDMLLEPNPEKRYHVPGLEELIDQGFLFLVAGSDTTAYSLACATYYILIHKEVLERLTAELRQDYSRTVTNPDWNYISQLPYLTAVIKESLRLSTGIPGILPRVVPDRGLKVGPHHIPGGTIVSISARAIHDSPKVFPEPEKFRPERWLGNKGKELETWNVSFSKGTRRCIGSSLAYLEMYLCLAVFFGRFDMTLFETDKESMEWLDHGVASNRSQVKVKIENQCH